MPVGPDGSIVQRAFDSGEITPAEWSRTDTPKHAHGLKTARNGYIMRQGGFTNRPGTAMVAQAAGQCRLIPFIFSNAAAFVLEFGDVYMRVYQGGAQVQSGGGPYQIVSPYALADIFNIQYVQTENVLYLACAGYPVYKLTCGGQTNWAFTKMNFLPSVPAPGNGNAPIFADNGGNLWYGTTHGYIEFDYYGTNPGHWDTQGSALSVGQNLIPGQNGYPDFTSGVFVKNYYMITSINLSTGQESYPQAGGISGWKCTAQGNISFGNDQRPPSFGSPVGNVQYGDTMTRWNAPNVETITGATLAFPLIINVADTSNFQGITNPLFTFAGTGTELDGYTSFAQVSAGQITFPSIDGTGLPNFQPGASITCLVSVVTSVPQATASSFVSGGIASPGQSTILYGNEILYSPVPMLNGFVQPLPGSQGTWDNRTLAFLDSCFTACPLNITWTAPTTPGNYVYNIYKQNPSGFWGFIATVDGLTYADVGTIPDISKSPPVYTAIGAGILGYPSVIGVYQQRLMLGNLPGKQDWVFASNTGAFNQFTFTQPTPVSSDTVQFEIAGQQYNCVTQMTDNGFLLIFTQTGEFSCYGSGTSYAAGPLTPTGIGLVQQGFYGASNLLRPITVGKNVLHLQTLQSKVRELLYNYYINGYSGSDLTVDSNHLFDGYTFVDWTYQQEPNSLIWMVRNDGALLCLTYVPELQLKAWTRCDTQGTFESVCAIPEGNEHALYAVVNRFGGTRFIERFASRNLPLVPTKKYITSGLNAGKVKTYMAPDPTEFVFMDCSSYYDGRNTTANVMNAISGDYTAQGAGFLMECGIGYFDPTMVGKAIMLYSPLTGATYRCEIIAYTTNKKVTCRPDVDLPPELQNVQTLNWALGIKIVTGLGYLYPGGYVSILADGAVLSSPSMETMLSIEYDYVTLDTWYAYVRVGLPYFSDMRALDIDTPQQGITAQDKPQLVERVAVFTEQTRGLWVGSRPPTDDDINPLEGLVAYKARTTESLGTPPEAKTGLFLAPVKPTWMYGGGAFIRQPDPLPMTVESIIPAGKFMLQGD
jgi:hypothetical protein